MTKYTFRAFGFLALCFSLWSCLGDTPFLEQKQKDAELIKQYAVSKSLVGTTTNSGLFYAITQRSTNAEAKPILAGDIVQIRYKLSTLDDQVVTSQNNYTFRPSVGSFFAGLSEGILFLRNKEGEAATFLLPSSLALGDKLTKLGNVTVPPNTVLRLDVNIVAVLTEVAQTELERGKISAAILALNPRPIFSRDTLDRQVFYARTQTSAAGKLLIDNREVSVTYKARRLGETATFEEKTAVFDYNVTNTQNSGLPSGLLVAMKIMRTGETNLTYITSSQAFKDIGKSGLVPPFTPVVYEITALSQQ